MRRDVQEIFRLTPHEKQCMMFSATLSKEIRPVCRKFMQDVSRGMAQLARLPTVTNNSAQQLWLSKGLSHSMTCTQASLPLVCQTGS